MLRRQFIQRAATLLGASLVPWGCGSVDQSALGVPGFSGWDLLARSLQGTLLFPGSKEFDRVSSPWNLRYLGKKPAAVARCLSSRDVQTCILWAQSQGVPLVARSGGHSYAGYSLTTGLMIDVSLMNQINFENSTGIARVGGGARNLDVYTALRAPSVSLTHGRCKAVGVAGLVLGGGIGFNMRARGLTCDQLVETEVVTAQGQILTCNAQQNSDLFWACRGGGGGNFGIHTSFTFQTFPVRTVTYFNLSWSSQQRAVFDALNQVLLSAPHELGCKVQLLQQPGQPLKVVLLGQLVGSPAQFQALLAPVSAIAAPTGPIQELAYWDAQEFLSEAGDPEFSHERSRYAFQPLSAEAVDTIFHFLERWPGTSVGANWKYFLQGERWLRWLHKTPPLCTGPPFSSPVSSWNGQPAIRPAWFRQMPSG
jgi:hypothetical protein